MDQQPILFRLAFLFGLALLGLSFSPASASAETVIVKMLSNHPDNPRSRNLFLPQVIHIQPGDVVRFVPTDPSHNVESIEGLMPEGSEKFKSKLSVEYEQTFDKAGIYPYKCTPHYAMGMVGLVIVGDAKPDIELFKAKKMPRRAAKKFKKMLKPFKEQ
ncbi:MAG: pseudoazurin [Cohaesibacter sp.]|jgi:pseudoazurin|nr:pseudoazurin [Cohaesibacter sp.]